MRTRLGVVAATSAALFLAPIAFSQQLEDPSQGAPTAALGTAFTYQGQLLDGGTPANGTYDLQLKLFNALSGGSQVGSTVTKDNVAVTDGLFTVELDFGASAFSGQALWLEIGVRPGVSSGSFTTLSPRQPLNPAPFAHYAKAGVATDVQCSGCVNVVDLAGGTAGTGQVLTATGGSAMAWQSPAWPTGSGNTGQVAFWSGSSTLSGSSNLFWDNANGRLGLGTTLPSEQLTLTGNLGLPLTSTTAGWISLGGRPFLHAYGSFSNTFLGAQAGNFTLTGSRNSAIGQTAFFHATSGQDDTATGYGAMFVNTTGSGNSAFGSNAMALNTSGTFNTAVGYNSLKSNTTASRNTAVGVGALWAQDFSNSGTPWDSDNTAVGYEALNHNSPSVTDDGIKNTAVGSMALRENTTGFQNVAVGNGALQSNTTAAHNTALGAGALFSQDYSNSDAAWGSDNTAVGYEALNKNNPTSIANGVWNTAIGSMALRANTTGSHNTAVGAAAGYLNEVGLQNVAVGQSAILGSKALSKNTAVGYAALSWGDSLGADVPYDTYNTAIGCWALRQNSPTTTSNGDRNTGVGANSLYSNSIGRQGTAVGFESLYNNRTGNYNVAIGYHALYDNTAGGGNIAIGHTAGAGFDGDNQLFIGNGLGTLIWGDIGAKRVAIGMTNGSYQLELATDSAGKPNGGSWANSSDARLKRDIEPLSGALEEILRLQGVSFEWVNPGEHGGRAESAGFIAQDVEQVFPNWFSFIDPSGADRTLVAPGEKVRSLTLPFEFDAYLVEAIREQQAEIEAQRVALAGKDRHAAEQDALIADLMQRVQALEETVRQQKRP